MVIVIVNYEADKNGRKKLIVSHGINESTGKVVILPSEPPEVIGAVYNAQIGEYILE